MFVLNNSTNVLTKALLGREYAELNVAQRPIFFRFFDEPEHVHARGQQLKIPPG